MLINPDTFNQIMSKKRMTKQALSDISRVGVKTIGRIKLRKELRPYNVEKIALALETDSRTLTETPDEVGIDTKWSTRMVTVVDHVDRLNFDLVERRYNTAQSVIVRYAPLLFTICAEMSLQKRRQAISTTESLIEALKTVIPLPRLDSSLPDATKGIEDVLKDERTSIEECDLGPKNNDYDEDPFERFLLDMVKDHPSLQIDFFEPWYDDCTYRCSQFDEELGEILGDIDGENYKKAQDAITDGKVRLKDIPDHLWGDACSQERQDWIASRFNGE